MSPSPANPLLDHIDQKYAELHPLAQAALKQGLLTGGLPAPTAVDPAQPVAQPAPIAPIPGPSAARPIVPRETPAQEELIAEGNRLNAAPLGRNDPLAHTAADTGRPGWEQIHNPFLRTLAGIGQTAGSMFFGGAPAMLIPGTTLHHQMLVNQNRAAVHAGEETENEQTKRAQEEATTGKTVAETGAIPGEEALRESQSRLADAHVTSLLHPEAKTAFEAWRKDNPTKPVEEWLKAEGTSKPEHNETAFDLWRKQNPTAAVADWLKLEAANKPGTENEYKDFHEGYLKSHPGAPAEEIVKAYAKAHQAPEQPSHALAIDPATNKFFEARAGVTAPAGMQTMAGVNAVNTPTMQMRNTAGQAQLVHEQTPHMLSEIDRLKGKLGPMAGRWNEVMQGKIGLNDPDFAGLRADLLMYSSAVALMHARGRLPENLREEFDKTINAPGQDFANLKAVIGRIDQWTAKNMEMGGKAAGGGVGGASKTDPAGIL